MGGIVIDVVGKGFEEFGKVDDVSVREIFEDLRGNAVFAGCSVVGKASQDISNVIGVAFDGGGVLKSGLVLYALCEIMYCSCFLLVTSVECAQKGAEGWPPLLSVVMAFYLHWELCGGRSLGWLVEVPILTSSLCKNLGVFTMSSLLLLVFLQPDAIC